MGHRHGVPNTGIINRVPVWLHAGIQINLDWECAWTMGLQVHGPNFVSVQVGIWHEWVHAGWAYLWDSMVSPFSSYQS